MVLNTHVYHVTHVLFPLKTIPDVVVESVTRSTLSSTGFVTFTDMATVVAAGKTPHSHDPDVLRVSIAPDPRDIIWKNANLNDSVNKGRQWTVSISLTTFSLIGIY